MRVVSVMMGRGSLVTHDHCLSGSGVNSKHRDQCGSGDFNSSNNEG